MPLTDAERDALLLRVAVCESVRDCDSDAVVDSLDVALWL